MYYISIIKLWIVCSLLFVSAVKDSYALDIIHPVIRTGSELDKYALRLAKFLLAKVDEPVNFIPYKEVINSQQRKVLLLKSGELSLDWLGSNQWIEEQVVTIPFPILRGLLGHRIFITNRNTITKISNIETIDQLKQFKIIQGQGWGDNEILRLAALNVKEVADFDSLFQLINAGRVDLFPRAVFEPYSELKFRPTLNNLVIDETLMLVYKFPMFYFVSPTQANKKLVDLLTTSFKASYQDGSFLEFFKNDELIKSTLAQIKMKQRKVFNIDNVYLTDLVKKIPAIYWVR